MSEDKTESNVTEEKSNLKICEKREAEELNEQPQNIEVVNQNLVETDVHLIGDMTAISQVIQLLAYIRNVIKNNHQKDIVVKIGKHVVNVPFAMSVNAQEIKDYIAQDSIEIN